MRAARLHSQSDAIGPITRRTAIAGLASVAVGSAGCVRRSNGKRVVRFWAFGREGEMVGKLVPDFEREHSDIEVEVQRLPWTAAHEKLLTAYAGETLPDLCQLGNTWLPEFVALDAVEPIDAFVAGSRDVALDDYFQGILGAYRIGSALYGIPWYVDTRLLFYRRDLLEQAGFAAPPQTWSDWEEMLAAIKSRVGPKRFSIFLPLNEFEPLLVLALQQPSEVLRDHGRWGNFRGVDFKRALSFYASMFARDWTPRMTDTQISNVWDEFGKGYFSFYISGPWNIAEFKKRLPPRLQDAWMTAPMPGPSGPGVSNAGGAGLVVFRTSQRKQEAWLLAEYLSRPQTQQRFYELTGDMPPRLSTWQTPVLAESIHARAFHEQLGRVRSPPKVPEWERIAQEMRLAGERVVQRASSVDAEATALDAKADRILEKRRWMLDHGRYT